MIIIRNHDINLVLLFYTIVCCTDKGNGHITSNQNQNNTDEHEEQLNQADTTTSNGSSEIVKWLFGLGIVIGIAVSWVAATQFAQSTFTNNFFAPAFNVWFSTVWIFVCYPVYIVGAVVIKSENRSWNGILALHR